MLPARLVLAAGLAGLAFVAPGVARAETYHTCAGFIDTLPAVITTQGTWCLRKDLATNQMTGAAISIDTNNVTLDCNGFKLGGLGAGTATYALGVRALNRLNAVVRGCSIRGFYEGIRVIGEGGGHTIEDNRLDGNRYSGLDVSGEGSVVRRNRVFDTGGSSVEVEAFGIITVSSVHVVDNMIDGVAAQAGADGNAYGIYTTSNYRGVVMGNRIAGVVGEGIGVGRGIWNDNSGSMAISGNVVVGTTQAGTVGIRCTNPDSVAANNIVISFATQVFNCTDVATSP